MKKSIPVIAGAAVLLIAFSGLTGCSVIGGLVGSARDRAAQRNYTVPGWEVSTIKPNTRIAILGKNGLRDNGKFLGLSRMNREDYAARFEAAAFESAALQAFPAPGDSVAVINVSGRRDVGVLIGYDLESVIVQAKNNETVRRIPFTGIATLRKTDADLIAARDIESLILQNQLPVMTEVAYTSTSGSRTMPVNDIDQITYESKTNQALTGFLIGAAIDAAIIITIDAESRARRRAEERRREACRRDPNCYSTSCPHIYSYDGEEFVLDSESFGGAIYRAAQRTDLDNLDHLREVDGTYRLSLRNDNDETEYVDRLSLLVVDHPRGSRIVPSFEGRLHVLSDLQAPVAAFDLSGTDMLSLVSETDEAVWISRPVGRDFEVAQTTRDGVEIEFPRPEDSENVTLVFNVRNTWWVSYLAGQVLSLQGNGLEEWYRELNTSREAQRVLFDAIVREGALAIEVWTGSEWQYGGFVWEVGPSVAKDMAVIVDLDNVTAETLRIRLTSTAGLWMINSVQADYSAAVPLRISEVFPESAVTEKGEDIRDLLKEEDGSYYVMPTTDDRAELVFRAPASEDGFERTFVLNTAGYYRIHVSGEGEPDRALVNRLLTEPGAIGAFSAARMNELVHRAVAELKAGGK